MSQAYSFAADAGGIGDGATDNSAAFNRLGADLLNSGATVVVVPGVYLFDHSLCLNSFRNIPKLRIVGYGATFQNTYVGQNGNGKRSWPLAYNVVLPTANSFLIAQTVIGSNQIRCLNPSDAANAIPGEKISIISLDEQYFGYPFNPDQFESAGVLSSDTSTGIILLDRNVRWLHRTDFPDGNANVATFPCGKARFWRMNVPTAGAPGGIVSWDIGHIYEGMQINPTLPGGVDSGVAHYQTFSGRSVRWINCSMPGISPTIIEKAVCQGCKFVDFSEPDKMVDFLDLDDCTTDQPGIGFQSSSTNHVRIRGGRYGGVNTGSAKYVEIVGAEIGTLSYGNTYGCARTVSVRDSVVRAITNPASDLTGGSNQSIDGVNASYIAGGTFAVLKAGTQATHWGLIPGTMLNVATAGGLFSGDVGTGALRQLREDATNFYFDTTLNWQTWPPWAGTVLRFLRCGAIRFDNVTGCDDARTASLAGKLGLREWEILHAVFGGTSATGGNFSTSKWCGSISQLIVNVVQASTVASSKFFINSSMLPNTTFTGAQTLSLGIDVTSRVSRTIDFLAFTNRQAADTLTFGGSPVTALPASQIIQSLGWGLTANSGALVELTVRFDTGLYGKQNTIQFDAGGNSIMNVTGMLL